MHLPRFPATAATAADARRYYHNRAAQLLWMGWRWDGRFVEHGWGVEVRYVDPAGVEHRSVFVLEGHTGRGHLGRWLAAEPDIPFVTSTRCPRMKAWLDARSVPHVTVAPAPWPAYAAIEAFYGDRRARRSGRYLMEHIDEGLYLLGVFGAAQVELDGWCLHPLVQGDDDLRATWSRGAAPWRGVDPRAVLLAMAYRHTANRWLSHHPTPAAAPQSPLPEVARMLMADKVQNRKDFERHLRGDLPNSDRLDAYFAGWLRGLGISEQRYVELARAVIERRGGQARVIAGLDGRSHLARCSSAITSEGSRSAGKGAERPADSTD